MCANPGKLLIPAKIEAYSSLLIEMMPEADPADNIGEQASQPG
jgi:hypothetical protein